MNKWIENPKNAFLLLVICESICLPMSLFCTPKVGQLIFCIAMTAGSIWVSFGLGGQHERSKK